MWLILHSLTLQPATVRRTLRFPRSSLMGGKIVPGVRLDSSPFEAGGSSWQVALYPCGVSASDANRVGVYLKLNGASGREVDATFSLALQVVPEVAPAALPAAASPPEGAASRGLEFRCGMTFCSAAEALESAGRCEDWGAHVYDSADLLSELESAADCTAGVGVELQIWNERACGRASEAFLEQTRRLPRGSVRVGEVIVALAGSPARVDDGGYRCEPGVEYRVMRLVAPDGSARFELDSSADRSSLVYLLPTSKAARGELDVAGSEDGVASVLLDDDTSGSSLPGARFLRRRKRRAGPKVTWGATTQEWQGVASREVAGRRAPRCAPSARLAPRPPLLPRALRLRRTHLGQRAAAAHGHRRLPALGRLLRLAARLGLCHPVPLDGINAVGRRRGARR